MVDRRHQPERNALVVTKTPFRVSLAGGGTDFEDFYSHNDFGAVVSFAINKFVYVTLKQHGAIFNERFRLSYSDVELVDSIEEIRNDIARGCLQFTKSDGPLYISTIADIPSASGLGSSASFAVGFLNALYGLNGIIAHPGKLAGDACEVEIGLLEKPIGKQDAYPAAFGGINYIQFESTGAVKVTPIIPKDTNWSDFASHFMLFWTGIGRAASDILAEQKYRTRSRQINSSLARIRKQADLIFENLSYKLDISLIGEILNEGWRLKRELASNISNNFIDDIYNRAMDSGALGGKLCGAGGGGFLFLLVPPEKQKSVCDALEKLHRLEVEIENVGSRILYPNY